MTEKLKPCPFCGEEPYLQFRESDKTLLDVEFYVECANPYCGVEPVTSGFETEEDAIAAWNRRAGDERPVAV